MTEILITLRNAQDHATALEVPVSVAIEMSAAPNLTGCLIEAADALLAATNGDTLLLAGRNIEYRTLPAKLRAVYVAEHLTTVLKDHALLCGANPEQAQAAQATLIPLGFPEASAAPVLAAVYVDLCEILTVESDTPELPSNPAGWIAYFRDLAAGSLTAQEALTAQAAADEAADEEPRNRPRDGGDEEPDRPRE